MNGCSWNSTKLYVFRVNHVELHIYDHCEIKKMKTSNVFVDIDDYKLKKLHLVLGVLFWIHKISVDQFFSALIIELVIYEVYTPWLLVSYPWLRVWLCYNPFFAALCHLLNWKLWTLKRSSFEPMTPWLSPYSQLKKTQERLFFTYFWNNNYYD